MEFILLDAILLILMIILKFIFNYNVKEIKALAHNEELDTIAEKYPDNTQMCKEYLKIIENENVKVVEDKTSNTSLYIAITNTISIANVRGSFSRIQTIAHECLHSIQNRRILIFNFIFSNIVILYFVIICLLAIFRILPYKMMFLAILVLLGLIQYSVRMFLENDAMIKAKYLAKEYLNYKKISTKEEQKKLIEGFDKINYIGIKSVNYNFLLGILAKVYIFSLICILFMK